MVPDGEAAQPIQLLITDRQDMQLPLRLIELQPQTG